MHSLRSLSAVVLAALTISASIVLVPAQSKNHARVTPATLDAPELVKRYEATITATTLSPPLYYLASDALEGRETGTRGQKAAAEYLAKQYRAMGLAPMGDPAHAKADPVEAYFQHYSLFQNTPAAMRLELAVNGTMVATSNFSPSMHDDLAYYGSGVATSGSADVVFGGYGIGDGALGYDDYAALAGKGISIDGKWLLLLADEPMSDAKTSALPTADHKLSDWTTRGLKKANAWIAAGKPKGIMIVSDLTPRNQTPFADASAAASKNAQRMGSLTLTPGYFPPAFNVSAKFADQMLGGSGHTIEELKQQIDLSLKPNVFELDKVQLKATIEARPPLDTENVLAYIEGSDPKLKNDVIVISAHHDHLGINPLLTGDQIFNGAADDGSGVTACLEMARAFMAAKKDGNGPRRSILFLNPSGEEKGILGSASYLNGNPTVPLTRMVADINMDGVAGFDVNHPTKSKNYIYIGGAAGLSDDLVVLNQQVKEATGSAIETSDKNFPSDNYNFEQMQIPYIYFSTGLTEHYHTVGDEAATIDFEHFARVTQLIFATAWQIANQDASIKHSDRNQLVLQGYVCRACNSECDNVVHSKPGVCPVCGMNLSPKFAVKK